jgi:hypothetical protein
MVLEAPLPLEARGLVKRYGHVVAVDGIDLNVHAGDIYGFLGPNGWLHEVQQARRRVPPGVGSTCGVPKLELRRRNRPFLGRGREFWHPTRIARSNSGRPSPMHDPGDHSRATRSTGATDSEASSTSTTEPPPER